MDVLGGLPLTGFDKKLFFGELLVAPVRMISVPWRPGIPGIIIPVVRISGQGAFFLKEVEFNNLEKWVAVVYFTQFKNFFSLNQAENGDFSARPVDFAVKKSLIQTQKASLRNIDFDRGVA
jgi:hypothetical protein